MSVQVWFLLLNKLFWVSELFLDFGIAVKEPVEYLLNFESYSILILKYTHFYVI